MWRFSIIKCPHCKLSVSLKGVQIDDSINVVCPYCKNIIDKDKLFYNDILLVPENKDMPIKCLNCNFVFITNTNDFYYKPGNIKCPKCKIELRRDSVIDVYKSYVEKENNSFEKKHPYLLALIFIGIVFLIVYIFVGIFS